MSSYRGPSQSHSRTSSTSSRSRSSRCTPPPQLPPAPATYTEDQLDCLEEQNDKHVTQRHLVYALDHVVQVLRTRGIEYGVMGGMSMILLGNQERTTTDVDVAVQVRTRDLLTAFAADNRVYIPRAAAVAGSGVARMFVLTGRSYGQNVPTLAVEVDLILNGEKGAPRVLQGATNTYTLNTTCGQRSYNIVRLQHLFLAKLRSFSIRDSDKDFNDLVWMSLSHSEIVREVAPQLDHDLKYNFAVHAGESLSSERVAFLYSLLGLSRSSSRSSSQGSRHSSGSGSRRVR